MNVRALRSPTPQATYAVDGALAALLCVIGVGSALLRKPPEGPVAVTLVVAFVMTGALAWRTRRPLTSATVITVAAVAQAVVSNSPGSLWALVVFLIATYSVAVAGSEERAALGGLIVVGGLLVDEFVDGGKDYLFIVLVFGGLWLLGRGTRQLMSRANHAEEHQRDLAKLAVAQERVRIARELHDVVGHGLSVIAIQADAASAALDHDSKLARSPLEAINVMARESLDEMRMMLELLRSDDEMPLRPPGLSDLDTLVATARDAGLPLGLRIEGSIDDLDQTTGRAAYRIVQEALTNVLKHAGKVRTELVVVQTVDDVLIDVWNAAGGASRLCGGSGNGLLGIEERVAAAGGVLTSGPAAHGGFRVHARLPLSVRTPDGTVV